MKAVNRKVLVTKQQWYEMNALAQGGAAKDYTASDEKNDDTEIPE